MTPEELAHSYLLSFWDGMLPVNPIRIANALSIQVFQDENLQSCNRSGEYRPGVISFNPHHHKNRIRFTVAHELGHHAFNHGPAAREDHSFSYSYKEQQANEFAAALIMPHEAITRLLTEGITSFSELSERFGVSPRAMEIRLERLGYL
ncbi:ImmA/IrrE family metallo-endopeptidase [Maridesulfovibrio ferrireducens]|uniref:ImmA/IrrE family metallo-endopeptidase n=1 Tax=Maridesulfovibrio ferrireducens TaxID=246191 RepID=UPI001A1CF2C5|nr:ImmA/IrrE family metallo-endopeptidase [Maridesulfovibrio ferrireducens]MBI9113263.1 ImmA/IrrE family metallo-endopeptidase [Maridesulfovibrio ferrireducens]